MQEAEAGSKAALREGNYPVRFSVEYPESSNRLTVLLRLILAAPIILLMQFLSGDTIIGQAGNSWEALLPFAVTLWIAPLLMIVFPRKYPLWCFDTYLELNRFSLRVLAYVLLLRDDYPSLDEQQAVSLQIEYPDVKGLRWTRFFGQVVKVDSSIEEEALKWPGRDDGSRRSSRRGWRWRHCGSGTRSR